MLLRYLQLLHVLLVLQPAGKPQIRYRSSSSGSSQTTARVPLLLQQQYPGLLMCPVLMLPALLLHRLDSRWLAHDCRRRHHQLQQQLQHRLVR
jgi:hypothetical protein